MFRHYKCKQFFSKSEVIIHNSAACKTVSKRDCFLHALFGCFLTIDTNTIVSASLASINHPPWIIEICDNK